MKATTPLNSMAAFSKNTEGTATPSSAPGDEVTSSLRLLTQCFNPRQHFPFEELKGSAAACGYVGDSIGHSGLFDRGDRVAPADDGNRVSIACYQLRNGHSAMRKCRHFKDSHGTVPHDRAGLGDLTGEEVNRFGSDVEGHPLRGKGLVPFDDLGFCVGRKSICEHVIDR